MPLPDLSQIIPFHNLALLGFYLVTIVYLVFTIIFYYHWSQYSMDLKVTTLTYVLYAITTIPLVLALAKVALSVS